MLELLMEPLLISRLLSVSLATLGGVASGFFLATRGRCSRSFQVSLSLMLTVMGTGALMDFVLSP